MTHLPRLALLVLLCSTVRCTAGDCSSISHSSPWLELVVGTVNSFTSGLACSNHPVPDPEPGPPGPEPDALEQPGAFCGPVTGDDPCVACAKASCCTESLSCFDDTACSCLVGCRTATGDTAAICSGAGQCGAATDAAYDAMTSCLQAHCAAECPRLQ